VKSCCRLWVKNLSLGVHLTTASGSRQLWDSYCSFAYSAFAAMKMGMSASASRVESAKFRLGNLPIQRINFSNALVAHHQWRVIRRETVPPVRFCPASSEIDARHTFSLLVRNPNTIKCRVLCIAALGGHLDECTRCGHRAPISYNSCRDRHCPKCQIAARDRWIAARRRELLPTRYLHVVFTLPHRLAPLVLQNKKVLYGLLFRTSAETLLEVARNPRHLGAEIGFFSVLHTWSQKLNIHPHVHCVVPAGGLSPDRTRWIRSRDNYFLPKEVLREVFRGKFVDALEQAFQNGHLNFQGDLKFLAQPKIFAAWLRPLYRHDWVVYLKRPFGGPNYVLQYLGRYTHRVAISNHRLVSFTDGQVTFRWRDSADHNKQKLLPLSVDEFLCRFLLHILPQGFVRIRHFGYLANRRRNTLLPLCFQLLGSAQEPPVGQHIASTEDALGLWRCPECGGPMKVVERLTAVEIQLRSPPLVTVAA
jgi:Putative transposase/Transposase zinc-binding domain